MCSWTPRTEEINQRRAEDMVEEERRETQAADSGLISLMAPVNPQVRLLTWYAVNCARCEDSWYEGMDGTPGGRTEARALSEVLRNWGMKLAPDGKSYREGCFNTMACAAEGHSWGDWERSHAVGCGDREIRFCLTCDDIEVRVVAAAPGGPFDA